MDRDEDRIQTFWDPPQALVKHLLHLGICCETDLELDLVSYILPNSPDLIFTDPNEAHCFAQEQFGPEQGQFWDEMFSVGRPDPEWILLPVPADQTWGSYSKQEY